MSVLTTMTLARAWAVRRRDEMVLGFTDHDVELRFEGIRFRPDSGLSARAVVQAVGLSVDNTEAAGVLSDDAITERDLMAGWWDSAEVRLWEVDWTDVATRRLIFRGHLGEVSRNGAAFRAELRGLSEPLNSPQGRVFHPRCSAVLGDEKCAMDLTRPGYFAEATVLSHDGARLLLDGVAGHEPGWFEQGRLLVLSGEGEGLHGRIKNDRALSGGQREIELWAALGTCPAVGDRLRLTAGCDKSSATCRAKFGNFLNFRGFPHLPTEDWLLTPQAETGRRR